MRELWRDVIWTSGAKIYALLGAVVAVAITARYLGPSGRGQIAVITTWVSAFATVTHLSLGQVALHRAARSADSDWLHEALPVLFLWCVLATAAGWFVAALLYAIAGQELFSGIDATLLALGFLLLPLMIWEQYGSSLLMAIGRLDIANRAQVFGRTTSLVGLVLAVVLAGPVVAWVIVSNVAGQLATALCGLGKFRGHAAGRLNAKTLREYLAAGCQLHLNAIGTFLFASADIIILNHYAGPQETGYYQIGLQLLAVMMVLPQAASSVLYTRVAELGPDAAWPGQRRVLIQVSAAMLAIMAAAALLAKWIIVVLAGPSFLPAVEVFRLQLVCAFGMSVAAIMAPQWIGRGLFKLASAITLAVGLVNLTTSLWLVPRFGKWGAAWANVITYAVAIVGNGLMAVWCERQALTQTLKA